MSRNESIWLDTQRWRNEEIGTGRALIALIQHYAAAIAFEAYEAGEWAWRVNVDYDGQTLTAEIASIYPPDALVVISALWGITEYVDLPDNDDREHWRPIAADCKRVFGAAFGVSPKLPIGATFVIDDGTCWRVLQARDRKGKLGRVIVEVASGE